MNKLEASIIYLHQSDSKYKILAHQQVLTENLDTKWHLEIQLAGKAGILEQLTK
jgi:hypothetical protein